MPLPTPKEAREMWAARLEANPDRQGVGCLAPTPTTRCCLGELCDMAVEIGVIEGYDANDPDVERYPKVMALVGLAESDGSHVDFDDGGERDYTSLADDNDNGATWPEIASIIRSEPEGLFT